jgi:hypothetical protein
LIDDSTLPTLATSALILPPDFSEALCTHGLSRNTSSASLIFETKILLNVVASWFLLNVPHELGIVDATVSFLRGVAARPDHSLETAITRAISIPGRERSVFPDKILIAGREGSQPVVLPIEIDRSTEPNVRRAQSNLSYLGEKFAAYQVYAYAGMPELEFGTPRFRVLTAVEGGEAKMRNVARTAFGICNGTAPIGFW